MAASHGKIEGIFTPNMVPLDARGNLDEAELRRYVDWLIDHGVHGLYPNGSTGEFTRLTRQERQRIVEVIVDQAAGRVPVLAGAAEANVRETLAACEHYAGLGVRAVAIVSPFYYRLSPENVYAYFKEIGRNTPVDVTLYNIPMFASPIDVPTIQRLSEECERIVAIKDSSGDISQMTRMIDAVRPNRPDFSFLCGWETALMPMLLMGCDGGTNATSGVVPEITRALYDTTKSGRLDEARRLQTALIRIFDAMVFGADFPEGVRVGVELRGFHMNAGRMPLSDTHAEKLTVIERQLQTLLNDATLYDGKPLLDRSSVKTSLPPIESIVENVVAVLYEQGLGAR